METKDGKVEVNISDGIGRLCFSHPKANSLPSHLLKEIADTLCELDSNSEVRVICLSSSGEKAFCAGASFEEFQRIESDEQGKDFFMGFSNCLLAMKSCSKFIVAKVQGKVVGGGAGLVAGADYVFAHESAALRLSEFDLGIGPFTIGPAVERKIGTASFSFASIDTQWRDASWSLERGLYSRVFEDHATLDQELSAFLSKLASASADATAAMKAMFWQGTENWEDLLTSRALISGRLLMRSKSQLGS